VRTSRIAKTITDFLAPWVIIIGVVAAVSWHASALWWGLLVVAGSSLGPIGWIRWQVRRGQISDLHVGLREQRKKVFALCLASVAAVLAALLIGHAPAQVVALTSAMLGTLVVTAAVTMGADWKISMHTAVAAGTVAMLAQLWQPAAVAAAGAAVVAVIGWSRIRLQDHTLWQAAAGAAAGAVTAGVLFAVLS
jgi:hypothetical protein